MFSDARKTGWRKGCKLIFENRNTWKFFSHSVLEYYSKEQKAVPPWSLNEDLYDCPCFPFPTLDHSPENII